MRAVLARVLAVAVAVGLVYGALQVRDVLFGDEPADAGGNGSGGSASSEQPTDAGTNQNPVLGCPDGAEWCADIPDDIEVVSAGAWEQAQELLAPQGTSDAAIDAWLVPSAWVDVVADVGELDGAAQVLGAPVATFGSTPMVIVLPEERAGPLRAHCGGEIGWSCVGEAVGPWAEIGGADAWGDLKPAHPRPTEALGLLVVAQAASDHLDETDFSRGDLTAGPFRTWLADLERAATFEVAGESLLRHLIETGAAEVDIVGTTEAEAAELAALGPTRNVPLTVVWPSPTIVAELVLVPVAGREEAAAAIADALQDLQVPQWRQNGAAPAGLAGAPPLDDPPRLPSGGALYALVESWQNLNVD